jgi:hypothetical protein
MNNSRRTNDYLTGGRPVTPQIGLTPLGSFKLGGQRFNIPVPDSARYVKVQHINSLTRDELILIDSVINKTSFHIYLQELFKLFDAEQHSITFSFKIRSINPTISMYNQAVPVGGYTVQNNIDVVGNITNEYDLPSGDFSVELITEMLNRTNAEQTVPEDYAEPNYTSGGDTVPT